MLTILGASPFEKIYFPKKSYKMGYPRWTLETFLQRAMKLHGDKYDYSEIRKEDIINQNSRIVITCKTCEWRWDISINSHLHGRNCPSCKGQLKWDLSRFLQRAVELHGDRYDYSEIKEEDIKGKNSKVPVRCKTCNHRWSPSVDCHINGKNRCRSCNGNLKLTLEKVIERAIAVHGDRYDYSEVTYDHIENNESKIPVRCKTCNHKWSPMITNLINGKHGCSSCRSSHGERECRNVLEEQGLEFETQVVLPELPRKRYDFAFVHEDHLYILEFDGEQHFKKSPRFHKKDEDFKKKQEIDLIKTKVALERGATLIRIDYTQIDKVYDHIYRAIEEGKDLYLSTPGMYLYITDRL